MEKEKPSLSAAGVAGFRAIEAEKAESERIIYDPYAYVFTPGRGILHSALGTIHR